MKTTTKINLFLPFLIIALISGCTEKVQYPIEPSIEFQGFATAKDITGKDSAGQITLSYTDGDGDIGLDSTQIEEPYKYNYFIKIKQLIDGNLVEFVPPPPNDSATFNARIPILTPNGRNKNIKGEIKRTIQLYYALQFLLSDTIAFEIYIQDRALNKSNVVNTPMFIISK